MANSLFKKLISVDLLRRAWHLARNDTRDNFMYDSFRYADFAFRLDAYLEALAEDIERETYRPKPLYLIDVPKSSLSVRPGTVVSIEDHIVLFSVVLLIAHRLDRKLPQNVYSWRIKDKPGKKEIFKDKEFLKLPFLKRKTIERHIEITEPWYGVWPKFIQDTRYAYEQQGYKYMVVSDITAYFENINLSVLKEHLLHHLPKEPKIINFLIDILYYWSNPTTHGLTIGRGLPQGNSISSFLGNFFLLPLDKRFAKFADRYDIKYFRYMDDVKVLTKNEVTARKALFAMNEELRNLHLNIQGAKTKILEDKEIRDELINKNLDEVNDVIESINNHPKPSTQMQKQWKNDLRKIRKKVRNKNKIISGQDFRTFRRLITANTLLCDPALLDLVLKQLHKNPDARLIKSAGRYFRFLYRNRSKIGAELENILTSRTPLFAYQEAHLLMTGRYLRNPPQNIIKYARKRLRQKTVHWYIRTQSALLLSMPPLDKRQLGSFKKLFHKEKHPEIKRALAVCLVQQPIEELQKDVQTMVFSVNPLIQKTGRLFHGLLFDEEAGRNTVTSIFNNFEETYFMDRIFEIELIKNSKSYDLRKKLYSELRKIKSNLHRPLVKKRTENILEQLKCSLKK